MEKNTVKTEPVAWFFYNETISRVVFRDEKPEGIDAVPLYEKPCNKEEPVCWRRDSGTNLYKYRTSEPKGLPSTPLYKN